MNNRLSVFVVKFPAALVDVYVEAFLDEVVDGHVISDTGHVISDTSRVVSDRSNFFACFLRRFLCFRPRKDFIDFLIKYYLE